MMRQSHTMRTFLLTAAAMLGCMLLPVTASAALWAFPQSVSISGSGSMTYDDGSAISVSVNMTGTRMMAGSHGIYGAYVDGRASGTYSVIMTLADGLGTCTSSGELDDSFSVHIGGTEPWFGRFELAQKYDKEHYPCSQGPHDALFLLNSLLVGCNATSPASHRLAEATNPVLTINQVYTGPCSSLTERAVIHNVSIGDFAEPIADGAPFDTATAPATHRWRNGAGRVLRVTVHTTGPGRVRATARHGNTVLGSAIVTASSAGTVTVPITLKPRPVNALLRTRARVPMVISVVGSTPGVTRRTTLRR